MRKIKRPRISIVIPIYDMIEGMSLLKRNLDSILAQHFKDYQIVVSDEYESEYIKRYFHHYSIKWIKHTGPKGMATNTNHAIDNADGELIKILYQDDFFYDANSLGRIVEYFTPKDKWLVTGCVHTFDGKNFENPHDPFYSQSENTIGSPSVLTIHRSVKKRFDPRFSWVLDLDLYNRLFRSYGQPKILNEFNVVIGLHKGQMTHILSDSDKLKELQILRSKK